MKNIDFALKLMKHYAQNNCFLYLVGGSVRDYLLFNDFKDFDFATPCLFKQNLKLLGVKEFDDFSARYGTLKTYYKNKEIEITTFRKEANYFNQRHPSEIEFIDDLYLDAQRRDFTINALYLDFEKKLIDPFNGLVDLKNKLIRVIGDNEAKLTEDPVRILRALRFALRLNFKLDPPLEKLIFDLSALIKVISPNRLSLEIRKMLEFNSPAEIQTIFEQYNLDINVKDYVV